MYGILPSPFVAIVMVNFLGGHGNLLLCLEKCRSDVVLSLLLWEVGGRVAIFFDW